MQVMDEFDYSVSENQRKLYQLDNWKLGHNHSWFFEVTVLQCMVDSRILEMITWPNRKFSDRTSRVVDCSGFQRFHGASFTCQLTIFLAFGLVSVFLLGAFDHFAVMIRRLSLILPGVVALCNDNSSVPCVQLPHGVQMPMVALGSWRGSYKDCANNNYSCAQEHARHAVQSWLQSLGGTHVDTDSCRLKRYYVLTFWLDLIGWLSCLSKSLVYRVQSAHYGKYLPSTTCGCIVYVRLFPWKSPLQHHRRHAQCYFYPPSPSQQWFETMIHSFRLKNKIINKWWLFSTWSLRGAVLKQNHNVGQKAPRKAPHWTWHQIRPTTTEHRSRWAKHWKLLDSHVSRSLSPRSALEP